jgi:hypothetical protein
MALRPAAPPVPVVPQPTAGAQAWLWPDGSPELLPAGPRGAAALLDVCSPLSR